MDDICGSDGFKLCNQISHVKMGNNDTHQRLPQTANGAEKESVAEWQKRPLSLEECLAQFKPIKKEEYKNGT